MFIIRGDWISGAIRISDGADEKLLNYAKRLFAVSNYILNTRRRCAKKMDSAQFSTLVKHAKITALLR